MGPCFRLAKRDQRAGGTYRLQGSDVRVLSRRRWQRRVLHVDRRGDAWRCQNPGRRNLKVEHETRETKEMIGLGLN